MSKGNINYKYLKRNRRRRSWFSRNKKVLIIIAAVIVIAVLVFGGIKLSKSGIFNKNSNSSNESGNTINDNQENNNDINGQSDNNDNVTWIDDKEPEIETYRRDYTVPADQKYPYFIKVNRAANCVTVYGIDENGSYSIPVIAFACSCGKPGDETIVGENYKTTDKYEWRLMVDNSYGHYAFRINGGYLFHSVPYLSAANDSLETDQYNKLGDFASLGCVRMCVRDVKWLYDNCPAGTKVTIYDDKDNPGPLGKPESIKLPEDNPDSKWDPTDPAEGNPWASHSASIDGTKDIVTKIGEKVNLSDGVTAKDTCGNDITDKIKTVGHYTFDQAGEYDIKYTVTDAIGSKAEKVVKLKVEK